VAIYDSDRLSRALHLLQLLLALLDVVSSIFSAPCPYSQLTLGLGLSRCALIATFTTNNVLCVMTLHNQSRDLLTADR
jgi:hypothetical protein